MLPAVAKFYSALLSPFVPYIADAWSQRIAVSGSI